jgi:hypothetical protein
MSWPRSGTTPGMAGAATDVEIAPVEAGDRPGVSGSGG